MKGEGSTAYQPMMNRSYAEAISEWIENHKLWEAGKHPNQLDGSAKGVRFYAEWDGNAPDVEYYRPDWKPEDMIWFQLYETVSEGTPLSPPFPTKKALVDWLSNNKDYWNHTWTPEQAAAIVEHEWAPSGIMANGKMYTAEESTLL